jgi:hypothetical protein
MFGHGVLCIKPRRGIFQKLAVWGNVSLATCQSNIFSAVATPVKSLKCTFPRGYAKTPTMRCCHPNRETWSAIAEAGFQQLQIEHFVLPVPLSGPHIAGYGVK